MTSPQSQYYHREREKLKKYQEADDQRFERVAFQASICHVERYFDEGISYVERLVETHKNILLNMKNDPRCFQFPKRLTDYEGTLKVRWENRPTEAELTAVNTAWLSQGEYWLFHFMPADEKPFLEVDLSR